jgi:hypothetical protein
MWTLCCVATYLELQGKTDYILVDTGYICINASMIAAVLKDTVENTIT